MPQRVSNLLIGLLAVVLIPSLVLAACEGFGAQTSGGAGKPIYRVTTLNDGGAGSLRDAVSQGNRMVIFDVGGTINLSSEITIRSAFLTIDGLSAPLPGMTLNGKGLIIRGTAGRDIIVRGLRIRNASQDGIWITDAASNVVIDRVSIHNSGDGNLDITRLNTRDISVCNSILAEPAGEEKNSLLSHSTRMTFHHNLFIAARQRNPQVTYDDTSARTQDPNTTLDMRNNLIWDWRGTYGTRIRYGAKANVVNNYYSSSDDALIICKGPGSVSECDGDNTNVARAYVRGNRNAADSLGTESTPFAAPAITMQTAEQAACTVVAQAGVRPLDAIDQSYVSRVTLSGCDAEEPPPPPPPSGTEQFFVNAGGATYTDSTGQVWNADKAYTSGSFGYVGGKTYTTRDPIANTPDDVLYQNVRYGSFTYRFDVPNGSYDVMLHASEVYWNALGRRIFDVHIEGVQVLNDYDVYAVAGHDGAVALSFPSIVVADGQLTISFVTVRDNAIISALAVQRSE